MINNLENVKKHIEESIVDLKNNVKELNYNNSASISDNLIMLTDMYKNENIFDSINILKLEEYKFTNKLISNLEEIIEKVNENISFKQSDHQNGEIIPTRKWILCYKKLIEIYNEAKNMHDCTIKEINESIKHYIEHPHSKFDGDKIYDIGKLNYYCQWLNNNINIVSINKECIELRGLNGIGIIVSINDFMEQLSYRLD